MKLPSVAFVVLEATGSPSFTEHPEIVITLGLVGLEIVHDWSLREKPVPFTRTSPPIRWLPGLSVIEGLVTVNGTVLKSPVFPVTVIVTERVHNALLEELSLEDRINDEVRVILEAYSEEMRNTGANYQEMFRKVKTELVRKYKAVL
jgi:hypothetical protein